MINDEELREKIKEYYPDFWKAVSDFHDSALFNRRDTITTIQNSLPSERFVHNVNEIYLKTYPISEGNSYDHNRQCYNSLFFQYLKNNEDKIPLWIDKITLYML